MASKKGAAGKNKDENRKPEEESESDISEDEDLARVPAKGKSVFSAFQALGLEDDDDDDDSQSDSGAESKQPIETVPAPKPIANQQTAKQTKKAKQKKGKQQEEDDLDKILEDLEKKPEPKGKKKDKKKQKAQEQEQEPVKEPVVESKPVAVNQEEPVTNDQPAVPETPETKSETAPVSKPEVEITETKPETVPKTEVVPEVTPEPETPVSKEATPVPAKDAALNDTAQDENNEEGADEKADKKKKKEKDKKKKKEKEKEKEEKKDDKKKAGKGKIELMREALRKQEEEKEKLRLKQEEEETKRREAEDRYLAKINKEKERKEKKKQKDKERVARLKAEGKYMTAEQKQKQQRQLQMIEMLKQQGYEVPGLDKEQEKPKRPKYIDKKKLKKNQNAENNSRDSTPMNEEAPAVTAETPDKEESPEEDSGAGDVKQDGVVESWEEAHAPKPPTSKRSAGPEGGKKGEGGESGSDDGDDDDDEDSSSDGASTSSEESSEGESEEVEKEEIPHHETKEEARIRIMHRIQKRREEGRARKTVDVLRSAVVCVLGHVDTGKTKILDKLRRTKVQDGEVGGITQQIGATMVPLEAISEQTKMIKDFVISEMKLPGLLIIDTPGHESFSNLRTRGSSLCDIAILVVDIMHGLEPQTLESINLLKKNKTPFIIALNKIDRLYEWKQNPHKDVRLGLKAQQKNTQMEFQERWNAVKVELAEQGFNVALYYDNKDPTEYVSVVPTSAHSGDGMGNLMAEVCRHSEVYLKERLAYCQDFQCTVLEVKALPGLGTTIDVILVNGEIKVGDTAVLAGTEGPIVTRIRELLKPQAMKELRVKNPYEHFKTLKGAQGIKLLANDLEKAMAGLPLLIAQKEDEIDILKEELSAMVKMALQSIKLSERGVYVHASTLGSLEALLEFLKTSKIPYFGINIGPVHRKDVMKASTMLEHDDGQYAVVLAFDVPVDRDAQEMADQQGVRIFQRDIIYHLFDAFTKYREEWNERKRKENEHLAVFPCKLKIMPQFVFNSRNPIVLGVVVESGILKKGAPLCVPSKEFVFLGNTSSVEINHKEVDIAKKGQEVCIKIENTTGEAPKMFGRHFDEKDLLVSKITRETIDVCKQYFRDDLQKADWQLMVELKKIFGIL